MNLFIKLYRFSTSWIGTIIIVLCFIFFIAQGFIIPTRSMVGTFYEGDMVFVKKFSYGITIPKIPWIELPILPDFNGNRHLISGDRPKRGDIVVFNPPHDDKTYFIKRAVAISGDSVVFTKDGLYIRPKQGDAYIKEHFKGYDLAVFFDKIYVKEPYTKENISIHYGGDNPAYSSFYFMLERLRGGMNNYPNSPSGIGMKPYKIGDDIIFKQDLAEDEFFMVGDNRDNSDDSRFWGSVSYDRIVGKPWFIYFSITFPTSVESDASKEVNRYKVRWDRMFAPIDSLQNLVIQMPNECRPYKTLDCQMLNLY